MSGSCQANDSRHAPTIAIGRRQRWVRRGRSGRERANLALPGLASRLHVTAWIQIAAGFVLLDFSIGYLSHRTLHMIPFMWRFHRVHHSDDFIDVTTTYRTHPVETVWRFLFAFVPVCPRRTRIR